MTGEQLIAEGRRLARPCVHLRPKGKVLAGFWGGEGLVPGGPALRKSHQHWLSIDCRYLPVGSGPKSGCLSLYSDEEDGDGSVVAVDEARELAKPGGGLPLYAHAETSLPPLEGVFRYGSAAVKQWLADNGWEPQDEYCDNFPDRKTAEVYLRAYQDQSPLYMDNAHAVLGGWHMPWPEGDWEALLDHQLLIWTFADAEPWLEVWRAGDGYRVIQRIT